MHKKKNYLHGQILLPQSDMNLNWRIDTFVSMVLHGCSHCILKYIRITLKYSFKKKATTYNSETQAHYLNFKFSLSLV